MWLAWAALWLHFSPGLLGTPPHQQTRKSALLKGDFVIGALFSLHHQPKQQRGDGALQCGDIREMYGIQRVEVTFMTLDRINADPALLPDVTLGVEIRDSCWYAPVALQQSIEFIRDAISPAAALEVCDSQQAPRRGGGAGAAHGRPPLVGVVGPASSSVAIQVQNLLQLFHIPQVGYSTTSKDLSDKGRFSYFLRVVPSDYYQAQVMVDLVRRHNWTYVSAVNTDENYGHSGIQAFRELAERADVCIAKEDSVLSNADDEVFEAVLRKLAQDQNARVVVCFCEGMTVRGLLRAARRLGLTGRFLFLGSDGWADRADVTDGYEHEATGSITIRINSPHVAEFDSYYLGLDPFTNLRNPWFREFWQFRFNCVLPLEGGDRRDSGAPRDASSPPPGADSPPVCTGKERLKERYRADPKLSFVMKALYTMAYGLHNMVQAVCGNGSRGVCPGLFPFDGSLFKSYLLNVSFTYDDDELVEFDRRGDPPGRYNIMNYQLLPNGSHDYVHVGDWNNGTLLMWHELQPPPPGHRVESVCSRPCPPGYYKNLQTGGQEKKCCWVCVPCASNEVLKDDTACEACPAGWWPNEDKTGCDQIPVEFTQWSDAQAVVAIFFSCLGFAATLSTAAVFVRHNDTPVVKSSTRELSYLILAGMTLSHAATFPILARPSWVSCLLARVLPGLSFAMIYASLLTKTNRIARILAGSKKRFPTRKPRFMSATAQVVITGLLIAVEAGVSAAMLVLEPPAPTLLFPALDRAVLDCDTSPTGVVAPLAFDALLVALCTLYALKTRNVPENFNEAKFIGFAMYTTCVIWVAFVPIYFGSDSKIITLCMCVTLSAMVTLVFLFLPKLYIILLRPERNNRSFFTTSKSIRCHIGSRVASAICAKGPACYPADESARERGGEFRRPALGSAGSNHQGPDRRGAVTWRAQPGGDVLLSDSAPRPRTVESRTLSCQTGHDLLLLLLQSQARRSTGWLELDPRTLLEDVCPADRGDTTPHILEESASDEDSSSGHVKNITIRLGDCASCSPAASMSESNL
ncbi:metabotropic glutamate receptor 1-like isoform X2 [Bacillus rossius redtenbacheri]|uniref:metabotropic glutamate receptor 1-like isoform X2 n=1 Tax=Bacillus rossius redtenbacheri TaxID=93214 RepID=UPI002FDE7130